MRFIPEAYDIQTMHIMSQGLFTNTSQCGPYRGAGRPEAAYFMERLIEHAARDDRHGSGRDQAPQPDPAEQAALHDADACGTTTAASSQRLMDKCIELSDWKGFAARKKASEKNGKLRGRAVSYYIEFGGIFNERMDLRFDPDGTLTVLGGTHSHGQGHATVFAQLVHEWLGVPFEAHPLRAGRHRPGPDRPRHLRRAQRDRRRQCAARRRATRSSRRASRWPPR